MEMSYLCNIYGGSECMSLEDSRVTVSITRWNMYICLILLINFGIDPVWCRETEKKRRGFIDATQALHLPADI